MWTRALPLWLAVVALLPGRVEACPFCAATQQTISEEMAANDLAVLLELVHRPKPAVEGAEIDPFSGDAGKCRFRVLEVLKGDPELCIPGSEIEILYFGDSPVKTHFYTFGVVEKPSIAWSTPTPLTPRSELYVKQLPKLPASGADRLAFFQDYLADADPLLDTDSYDEFARAPYADVRALGPRMNRKQLLEWVADTNLSNNRRRLFLTMLGACGQPEDIPLLESLIHNEDRQVRGALDALVSCYLNLKGEEGLPLVEDLFLRNPDAEYTETYATIMALRIHGQEMQTIPQQRLVKSLRLMLDRPKLADLVIMDLARWQDWEAAEKLVQLFKASIPPADQKPEDVFQDTSWVRVPVIQFLRACPREEAKTFLGELEQLDPESFRRANYYLPFGMSSSGPTRAEAEKSDKEQPPSDTPAKTEPAAAPPAKGEAALPRGGRDSAVGQFSVTDDLSRQMPRTVRSGYRVEPAAPAEARAMVAAAGGSGVRRAAPAEGNAWLGVWGVPIASLLMAALLAGIMNAVLRGNALRRSV